MITSQNIFYLLGECFGLDSIIAKYTKKKNPLAYSQWDFECLSSGIEFALNDKELRNSFPQTRNSHSPNS